MFNRLTTNVLLLGRVTWCGCERLVNDNDYHLFAFVCCVYNRYYMLEKRIWNLPCFSFRDEYDAATMLTTTTTLGWKDRKPTRYCIGSSYICPISMFWTIKVVIKIWKPSELDLLMMLLMMMDWTCREQQISGNPLTMTLISIYTIY